MSKVLPKIEFAFIDHPPGSIPVEHYVRLDRNGMLNLLGTIHVYSTTREYTTWSDDGSTRFLVAKNLTPQNIDDFINDDVPFGVLFGTALLGGMVLGRAMHRPYYPYPVYGYPYRYPYGYY